MATVRKLPGSKSIRAINKEIAAMPTTAAVEAAAKVAPILTGFVQADYTSGRTVYGEPRPPHPRTGRVPTLIATGKTLASIAFTSDGTILRAKLTGDHVKYLIGWFKIMPIGNAAIPAKWKRAIDKAFDAVMASRGGRRAA